MSSQFESIPLADAVWRYYDPARYNANIFTQFGLQVSSGQWRKPSGGAQIGECMVYNLGNKPRVA